MGVTGETHGRTGGGGGGGVRDAFQICKEGRGSPTSSLTNRHSLLRAPERRAYFTRLCLVIWGNLRKSYRERRNSAFWIKAPSAFANSVLPTTGIVVPLPLCIVWSIFHAWFSHPLVSLWVFPPLTTSPQPRIPDNHVKSHPLGTEISLTCQAPAGRWTTLGERLTAGPKPALQSQASLRPGLQFQFPM